MAKNLRDISAKMKKLDICMFTTVGGLGSMSSRPMSNNGEVEYDGHSYFFTWEKSRLAKDIMANPQVSLSFEAPKQLFISVAGKARLIRSRSKMEPFWLKELEQWFKEGIDTPGLVMIHVKANRIRYWQKEEQGEVKL